MFGSDLMWFIAGIPGILIAMVVHEYSHARVAVAMGDMTPRLMGRLTLNPKAHIDPIGLLMLFIVHFGWAKPVMVNPRNFRDMRKGEILVALAGPASNLVVAFLTIVFMLLYARLGLPTTDGFFTVMDSCYHQYQFCLVQHSSIAAARWFARPHDVAAGTLGV